MVFYRGRGYRGRGRFRVNRRNGRGKGRGRGFQNKKRREQRAMMPVFFRNPVMGQAFPDRLRTKMVFDDETNFLGGSFSDNVFLGNGVFDPDTSLGGLSAYQFAELIRNYTRFCVYSSSIRCDLINNTGNQGVLLTIVPSSSTTLFTTVSQTISQPWSKYPRICGTGGNHPVTMRHFAESTTMLGVNRLQLKDNSFCGSSVADPVQKWFWHVVIAAVDGVTVVNLNLRTRIVYYVEWFDKTITRA